jgi:hypothetical protein
MTKIGDDNRLGRCFLHKRTITKGLVKEKDYKCAGCGHALKYDKNYWRTSTGVKAYLNKKGLEFKESQTKSGGKTLITKKVQNAVQEA